jgi:hypothetical protein
VPERADKLEHEFFGGKINDPPFRIALTDGPGNRMHEVGFAEPDAAIEEERVERHRIAFSHPPRGGIGELIRFADHEILEGEARVERCPEFDFTHRLIAGIAVDNRG